MLRTWAVAFCIALCAIADSPAADRPSTPKLLQIEWRRGLNLPQGFQDSDGGFLHDQLITVGGFCSGGLEEDNRRKPGRYPRGFLRKAWALSPSSAEWKPIADFPGVGRQGHFAAIVGEAMYVWGGFNYDAPFCYRDGWKLSRPADGWKWDALPPLPHALTSSALAVVGTRIYAMGGADYDGVVGFWTESDRAGKMPRLGARLLVFDTGEDSPQWRPLPECPGAPRFVHTTQAIGADLFIIGGATGVRRDRKDVGYCTVVDNWRYDTVSGKWSRLPDTPVSSGNFPRSVSLVFRGRYIVLPGGHQYAHVANPDGTVREKFGIASQKRPASGLHNDVFVFDAQTGKFGSADLLPIDNNLPMAVVRGDEIHLLGGETGGGMVDGEYFGHHPDLYLIGHIREAN